MSGLHLLGPREDTGVADRLALSAATTDGARTSVARAREWLRARCAAHVFEVARISFRDLDGWATAPGTGNLVHRSGRFFSVEGLRVQGDDGLVRHQPIINQPEVGILGILVKEFDGVLHCLMQAKVEPGNPSPVQLAPTVQATRSNYSRVHRGAAVKHIDRFTSPGQDRVIVDVLQSEPGEWFFRKRNRNMVIEIEDDPDVGDDFCWLTLGQLDELLTLDNVVNMCSRSVLACIPRGTWPTGSVTSDPFGSAVAASRDTRAGALRTTTEVLSWFTGQRVGDGSDPTRIPLWDLPGWYRSDDEIARDDGRQFRVVAVRVTAAGREASSWTQPLLEPRARGVAAFLVAEFDGVLHVLIQALPEVGLINGVELAPTLQCTPQDRPAGGARPPFYDQIVSADPARIRYRAVHAEEGSRFLRAESTYLIVEADGSGTADPPPGHTWVTVSQLNALLRHGLQVNLQARTLVACLNALG